MTDINCFHNILDRYLDHMCDENKLAQKHSNLACHALKVKYIVNVGLLVLILKNIFEKKKQ